MKAGDDRSAVDLELAPVEVGDRLVGVEEFAGGETAERNEDRGIDALDLGVEYGRPRLDLVDVRVAIFGRAHLDDVADVQLGAVVADGVERAVELLARLPDERRALFYFLGARRLPDQHRVGVERARAADEAVWVELVVGNRGEGVGELRLGLPAGVVVGGHSRIVVRRFRRKWLGGVDAGRALS